MKINPWEDPNPPESYYIEISRREVRDMITRWFCFGYLVGIVSFWAIASLIDKFIERWPS